MLGRPRSAEAHRALEQALTALMALFEEAGHTPIAPPHLYLGEALLDLYGEDLRARAFLFPDAERGNELCLRPDFTVPIATAHGENGWDRPAAHAYAGLVFRRQPQGQGRPVEYHQAGIERFGDPDPVVADAAVFSLLLQGLAQLGVHAPEVTIGDLSIPFALLDALDMPERRRAALRRHIWRPARFQDLLARASAPMAPTLGRQRLMAIAGDAGALAEDIARTGEPVGKRRPDEVAARVQSLAAGADDPPMPRADARLIEDLFTVKGPAPAALAHLRALTRGAGIDAATDRFADRLDALADRGADPARMHYDAGFGRNLEYYDGFVFEMTEARGHPQPLAGGGRYDTLTARLGAAEPVPAVGGMIRAESALDTAGGRS